jgi:hypothetical protein
LHTVFCAQAAGQIARMRRSTESKSFFVLMTPSLFEWNKSLLAAIDRLANSCWFAAGADPDFFPSTLHCKISERPDPT